MLIVISKCYLHIIFILNLPEKANELEKNKK